MAIIKELNTKFGVNASYHRITATSINYLKKKVIICVASYLSKEARINKNTPLEEIDIEIPINDYHKFKNANPIEVAYLWLKENAVDMEDSIDDLDVIEEPLVFEEEINDE